MIKTLLFSTLYPNSIQRQHGLFVENRLQNLLRTGVLKTKIIAPVPWFPFKTSIFGKYAQFPRIPYEEQQNSVDVLHPRYFVFPKYGMNSTPEFMYRAALPYAKSLIETGFDFDLIDAHYFYPDGVAAVKLAKILNKPVVITARGTDVNLIPKYTNPRKKILWAAENANHIITVCEALKNELVRIGGSENKISVLRNGVDLTKFYPPKDRHLLRRKMGFSGKSVLSVGHLVERKGHHLVVDAIKQLPDVNLYIAGDGEERESLQGRIRDNNLQNRVILLGAVPHDRLTDYYGASDITVLASSREGWANVLLESMACGTPVVATNIWGTPEVVKQKESGVLIDGQNSLSIADGIMKLYKEYPDRTKTRSYAEKFGWDGTTQGQLDIFAKVIKDFR